MPRYLVYKVAHRRRYHCKLTEGFQPRVSAQRSGAPCPCSTRWVTNKTNLSRLPDEPRVSHPNQQTWNQACQRIVSTTNDIARRSPQFDSPVSTSALGRLGLPWRQRCCLHWQSKRLLPHGGCCEYIYPGDMYTYLTMRSIYRHPSSQALPHST